MFRSSAASVLLAVTGSPQLWLLLYKWKAGILDLIGPSVSISKDPGFILIDYLVM